MYNEVMESHEMPLPEKKENVSSIRKVIGVQKEVEEVIKNNFAQKFANQDFLIELEQRGIKEIEKTPEQIEGIKYANKLINGVSEKYVGQGFKIPVDNKVHIFKEEDLRKFYKIGKNHYSPEKQAICLKEAFSLLGLIKSTSHEYTHFESYQILRYSKDNDNLLMGQLGMTVFGKIKEKEYFRNLTEGTTEELTKRIFNKEILNKEVLRVKNPKLFELLKEEIEEVEKKREKITIEKSDADPTEIVSVKKETDGKIIKELFTKYTERKALNNLIDKLYSKNKEKFKDKDEVFDLFAESLFTGKLRWARLVNESWGDGTLQGLAKADKNVDELGKFVDGLKV
jgi:hypothetical protein